MTADQYEDAEDLATSNRDAEIGVLRAIFQLPVSRKRIATIMTGADLYWPEHEVIWDAVFQLAQDGQPIASSSLIEQIRADKAAMALLPELPAAMLVQGEGETAASIVHNLATKRRTVMALSGALSEARSPNISADGFLAKLVNTFTTMRDQGASGEIAAVTVRQLLDTEDDPYDWVIPNLLERGDRFMLTGGEGMGKSVLLRQIALCAAAGISPFGGGSFDPVKSLIIDNENSERQIRRGMRSLAAAMKDRGARDATEYTKVEWMGRIDITKDLTLSRIHQTLDAVKPSLLVIGPLYRLTSGAITTDDEAAPILAALDTIKARGIAILIEAHAGHSNTGAGGGRNMRPRGSSALLGWPEFGYGLQPSNQREGEFVLDRWRGDRDERAWPEFLERGGPLPWSPTEQQFVTWGAAIDKQRRRPANPWETGYRP